jgi:LysR family transcriptional regulator, low CO2-responsive transcriptional regulator
MARRARERSSEYVKVPEPLDGRRLLAFWWIAKTGSIATAASEMHLTSSAMSHSLKSLEDELGCRLFERRGHRALLTAAGARMLPRVESVLREMRAIRDELLQLNEWGRGLLRLGASAAACQYILPDVLLEFRECFPECEVDVASVDAPSAVDMVHSGALDLALTLSHGTQAGLAKRPLFEDELVIVVSPRHPWASLRRVSAKDLRGQKLIVYNRDSLTHQMIRNHLEAIGAERVSFVTLNSMEAIKEMARVGLCPAVVAPWVAERELKAGALRALRISGPKLRRHWAALWPENRPLSVIAQVFVGLCRDVTTLAPFAPSPATSLGKQT